MKFGALADELALEGDAPLDEDLERLARPKRRPKKLGATPALLPLVEGPGRYIVLGHDEPLTIRATHYVDPDGLVRYRTHTPGGYVVVLEREATEEELNEAAAQAGKERAR